MADLPNSICLTQSVGGELRKFFSVRRFTQVAVLVDEHTKKHCYPIVSKTLPPHTLIEIPAGENHKNLRTCEIIWDSLTSLAFDRKSLLVNLGGGVIGDMGGFCAATYKRGIEFINIPTTLLAQVDASIGGKLGIDFRGFKNHIGVFQNPLMVFLDTVFYATLDPAELRSGFAEIIKHCLIRDAKKFQLLLNTPFEALDLFDLVKHSVQIKKAVVEEDPTEKGLRKILNFGHTIGHAIESFYLDTPGKRLLHGEAIAIGMICEAWLSRNKLSLSEFELFAITEYILNIYQPVEISEMDIAGIIGLTIQDKKNEGDIIQSSLLQKIGDCTFNIPINHREIGDAIRYFNESIKAYTK
ncbi:MAG: 3-dehydroquinate synthase [Cyclobacteriaceae bacterium]|nr:3-dehydroquinate synthase [Cyclobacteriaceae bacterium]